VTVNRITESRPRHGRGGRIRYAIIGLGWIAQSAMLPGFANARGNYALTALVSDDPEKSGPLARAVWRRSHLPLPPSMKIACGAGKLTRCASPAQPSASGVCRAGRPRRLPDRHRGGPVRAAWRAARVHVLVCGTDPSGRRETAEGAGPMEYIGVYCLNAARLFADEPEDAFALETASLIRSSRVAGVATFTSMPPTAPTSA
jgi:hypothetical protein